MPGDVLTLLSQGGITRKLRKLVRELDALLRQEEKDARGIHKLRRHTKKLRAWLNLLQVDSRSRKLKRIEKQLKILAKAYSGQRDARVLLDTLDRLTQLGSAPNLVTDTAASANPEASDDFPTCSQALRPALEEAMAVPAHVQHVDTVKLEKALLGLRSTFEQEHEESTLRGGLRHSYRKARRLYLNALDERSHENFHRLRRWVKYLAAQMELVVLCRSDSSRRQLKLLTDLGSTLGRYHDLDVLQLHLQKLQEDEEQDPILAHELTRLQQVAAQEEARLQEESLELAECCFRKKPKRFAQPAT